VHYRLPDRKTRYVVTVRNPQHNGPGRGSSYTAAAG
jgi:hypothetical protein